MFETTTQIFLFGGVKSQRQGTQEEKMGEKKGFDGLDTHG